MTEPFTVRALSAEEAHARAAELAAILADCVEGGASVSFMAPLAPEKAIDFWRRAADAVAAGSRILLAAEDASTGELAGTVQLLLDLPENQPHRAEIAKMLVRRSARRRGLGALLMRAADAAAREAGKTLLVLDTVTGGDAERLYTRLGWTRVGVIPDYALMPDGRPCATTLFYKSLVDAGSRDRDHAIHPLSQGLGEEAGGEGRRRRSEHHRPSPAAETTRNAKRPPRA